MDKSAYIKLYKSLKIQPLFNNPEWWNALCKTWDVVSIEYKNSKIFLPYCLEKKLGVHLLRNPLLIPYLQPLSDRLWSPEEVTMISNLLLQKLPPAEVIEIDLMPSILPSISIKKSSLKIFHTNYLALDSKSSIYNSFKSSLKRQIKKAESSLICNETTDIELFISLYHKTFEKLDSSPPIPDTYFKKAWNVCQKMNCGNLYIIQDIQGNTHASIFCVYDATHAYYLAGGTDSSFYGSGAMSKLMWYTIEKCIEKGCVIFDFEGSRIPNVNRFFQNFNPYQVPIAQISKNDSFLFSMYQKLKQ